MDKLSKSDKDFYSKISNMRKIKSGGKYFQNKEAAKAAQAKGLQVRLRNAAERTEKET